MKGALLGLKTNRIVSDHGHNHGHYVQRPVK